MSQAHPSGLPPTEREAAVDTPLDSLAPEALVERMLDEEARSVAAMRPAARAIAAVARAAAEALGGGGAVVFCGAGTSGRLGAIEAAECVPTFSADPGRVRAILAGGPEAFLRAKEGAEDDLEGGAAALRTDGAGRGDLVIGIAASGRTPFVRGALLEAGRRGARTALVTSNPAVQAEAPPPAEMLVVLETGPEALPGSTRLKAGTAAKIALNAVTTAAFASLGAVFEGQMVSVRATNAKLRDRAVRIVRRLTDATDDAARAALSEADGNVKEAVVMVAAGLDRRAAAEVLARAGGCLRRALGR